MRPFEYFEPSTITEASEILEKNYKTAIPLAGGTDIIPQMRSGKISPTTLVNLKRIPDLYGIELKDGLSIGPLVTLNSLIHSPLVQEHCPGLVEVCLDMATHQVRNLATIGGNICNAAPSADTAPLLLVKGATMTLAGKGERTILLKDFFVGPGETVLRPGEIVKRLHVPRRPENTGIAYAKHGVRRSLEIAIVGVAALVTLDSDSTCTDCKISIGACAPTPLLMEGTQLEGKRITEEDIESIARAASQFTSPISDVRSSDGYRKDMVFVMTKRAIYEALERAKEGWK